MTCELSDEVRDTVNKEIEDWLTCNSDGRLFLLDITSDGVDSCTVNLLLGSEYEVKLLVPSGYPNHTDSFMVESGPVLQTWTIAINEFIVESSQKLAISDVLDKAVQLFSEKQKVSTDSSEDEEEEEMEEETEEAVDTMDDLEDEDTFTTAWDLKVTRKKSRWIKKEPIVRAMMKEKRLSQGEELRKQTTRQIFTSNAAFGILTNDLIKIMECEKTGGFSAEPIDDNIYHWKVKLQQFLPGSFRQKLFHLGRVICPNAKALRTSNLYGEIVADTGDRTLEPWIDRLTFLQTELVGRAVCKPHSYSSAIF